MAAEESKGAEKSKGAPATPDAPATPSEAFLNGKVTLDQITDRTKLPYGATCDDMKRVLGITSKEYYQLIGEIDARFAKMEISELEVIFPSAPSGSDVLQGTPPPLTPNVLWSKYRFSRSPWARDHNKTSAGY